MMAQTVDKLDENPACLQSFLVWRGNEAVDFRSRRFAFRGAGGEPPDMNETVKVPTLHQVCFCFWALLRREAILGSFT
jgi:hypothetical protein